MNCILYALYLPSFNKAYVIEEIFAYLAERQADATIFVGIQGNSISETEDLLDKMKGSLKLVVSRVPPSLTIDSDASGFIEALKLYSQSPMDFDRCYFIHTKGITSNNDALRKTMFDELFDEATIQERFSNPQVGSYGPYITLTNVNADLEKMACLRKFNSKAFQYPVLGYYYINTLYVIKNELVKRFMSDVSPEFFTTHVDLISDRWMFERDFMHLVDMQGHQPSFKRFHGNYSTNYRMPTMIEYEQKLSDWKRR